MKRYFVNAHGCLQFNALNNTIKTVEVPQGVSICCLSPLGANLDDRSTSEALPQFFNNKLSLDKLSSLIRQSPENYFLSNDLTYDSNLSDRKKMIMNKYPKVYTAGMQIPDYLFYADSEIAKDTGCGLMEVGENKFNYRFYNGQKLTLSDLFNNKTLSVKSQSNKNDLFSVIKKEINPIYSAINKNYQTVDIVIATCSIAKFNMGCVELKCDLVKEIKLMKNHTVYFETADSENLLQKIQELSEISDDIDNIHKFNSNSNIQENTLKFKEVHNMLLPNIERNKSKGFNPF